MSFTQLYGGERAGKQSLNFDPVANRMRQQKEDMLALATDKAGQGAEDLVAKVDKYSQPVQQTLSTISDTKKAVQSIQKSNLARRLTSSNPLTKPSAQDPFSGSNKPIPLQGGAGEPDKPSLSDPFRVSQSRPPQAPTPRGAPPTDTQAPAVIRTDNNPFSPSNVMNRDGSAKPLTAQQKALPSFEELGIKTPQAPATAGSGGRLTKLDPMEMADRSSRPTFGSFNPVQAGEDAKEFGQSAMSLKQGSSVLRPSGLNISSLTGQSNNPVNTALNSIKTNKPSMPNPHASLSGATEDADSLVSKVSSTASKVSEGVDAGLGVAGDVMDALGPIGDLIGIGLSIFGGIEGHKAEEQKEEAQQQQASQVSKPITQSSAAPIGATLKTSGTQQIVSSHS